MTERDETKKFSVSHWFWLIGWWLVMAVWLATAWDGAPPHGMAIPWAPHGTTSDPSRRPGLQGLLPLRRLPTRSDGRSASHGIASQARLGRQGAQESQGNLRWLRRVGLETSMERSAVE